MPRLILGDTKPALITFAAAAALLLLITCINVANLLLVRGLTRIREIAVRSALGAGRRRVIAQLLTENALLAVAGGALGVAVAIVAVQGFIAFAPSSVPRLDEIHVNATALAGAVGITALAMLIFALAPAVMTSRVELQQMLRSGARQTSGWLSRFVTEGLVAGQVALALLVLSAAGLIGKSLIKLERADLSLEPSRLLIAELALRYDQFDSKEKQLALLDRLVTRLKEIPDVRGVSPVVAAPFSGTGGWDGRPASEGQSPEQASGNPMLNMEVVAPEYFATLGISVLRGRGFTDQDRQGIPGVIMLSESAARHYWPGADPIGKRLLMGEKLDLPLTVVGIVPGHALPRSTGCAPEHLLPAASVVLPLRTDDAGDPYARTAGGARADDSARDRRDRSGCRTRERRALRDASRAAARAAASQRVSARRVCRCWRRTRRHRSVRRYVNDGASTDA